jgi:hypothetical protein
MHASIEGSERCVKPCTYVGFDWEKRSAITPSSEVLELCELTMWKMQMGHHSESMKKGSDQGM